MEQSTELNIGEKVNTYPKATALRSRAWQRADIDESQLKHFPPDWRCSPVPNQLHLIETSVVPSNQMCQKAHDTIGEMLRENQNYPDGYDCRT